MYKSVGCSKVAAVCLLLLILCSILLIAIVASFARPRCIPTDDETSDTQTPSQKGPIMGDDGRPFGWQEIRLPNDIKPLNYTLFLHPNLTTNQVLGSVEIVMNATKSTNFIVFHAASMNITKPSKIDLQGSDSKINIVKMQRTKKNEQVYLKLASKIQQGRKYVLNLDFDYTLADGLNGFYRSTYKVGEEERVLATTQFEPTDARKAFPCFDEPNLKATFKLTLIREKRHITLSNMPLLGASTPYTGSKSTAGLVQDEYTESVIMSTYLVAFVVCDFKNISDRTESAIPAQQQHGHEFVKVAVFASEDKLSQTQLALDVLKYTIPEYERFFGVKYPLPKQDMIAIPDFAAGAMENWGLITYRQASILHKENVTSDASKQWIVQTITHELAHQWFGNLVTMDWWTDLWLNEGFATYVEYIGTSKYVQNSNLGWRMMDQFVVSTMQSAMNTDSLSDSHPILVEVRSPGEINEIFDSISYSKGASIIWMLNNYVTEDVFQKGLTSYLKMYQYSNAKTADLWNAIANARKDNGKHTDTNEISDMMDTWTRQMGYPVVTMARSGGTITATQKQFLIYSNGKPSDDFASKYNYKWTIPLTVVTSSDPKPDTQRISESQKTLFTKDQDSATLTINPNVQWYKANYKQNGFYRVNYLRPELAAIKEPT
ncbi:endoplasmic reticulum aminopeptidase 1-like isoform X2 [Amphiura filiformis]|uniref:endoplasmic reticulum aminopeptidase 1-like isoform X2 n=1 Tax=Amphiura filiformis TaxID=82378 RepID=UPI003B2117BC